MYELGTQKTINKSFSCGAYSATAKNYTSPIPPNPFYWVAASCVPLACHLKLIFPNLCWSFVESRVEVARFISQIFPIQFGRFSLLNIQKLVHRTICLFK